MRAYIDYLTQWLGEELAYRGANRFIFGISGGVDSAVIAGLLAKAYPKQSLGVVMPCHSNPQDEADAELVMEHYQLPLHRVDLTATHTLIKEAIGPLYNHHSDAKEDRVVNGNLAARLRMTTLFTIAQVEGGIVVGTDNAVEWYTGYFTKFGDGAADIVPLLHLNKDDIYEMAALLDVPKKIIEKEPSAGLWEAQTDEDEMGTTYQMLNRHLLGESVPPEDEKVIAYWHERSHHKRMMPRTPKPYRI